MPGNLTREYLSGGTANGRPIKISATSSPGDTIHTSGGKDLIYIFATNTDSVDHVVTLQVGGTTAIDDAIPKTIPKLGSTSGDGRFFMGAFLLASTLVLRAYADLTNKVNITGYVIRDV